MEIGGHGQRVVGVPRFDDLDREAGSAHLSPQHEEPVDLGHAAAYRCPAPMAVRPLGSAAAAGGLLTAAWPPPTHSHSRPEPTPVHPLDNPVWSSLEGTHRHLAEPAGRRPATRPSVALRRVRRHPGPGHWRAMEELVGPGGVVIVTGRVGDPPDGWGVETTVSGPTIGGT